MMLGGSTLRVKHPITLPCQRAIVYSGCKKNKCALRGRLRNKDARCPAHVLRRRVSVVPLRTPSLGAALSKPAGQGSFPK